MFMCTLYEYFTCTLCEQVYRDPPMFGPQFGATTTRLLPCAVVLHCCVGVCTTDYSLSLSLSLSLSVSLSLSLTLYCPRCVDLGAAR